MMATASQEGRKDPAATEDPGTVKALARSELNRAGLRVTIPRLAVFGVLRCCGAPLSHREVSRILSDQTIDATTVYRNLLALTKAGIAERVDFGDHIWRFSAKGRANRIVDHKVRHPHFLCRKCGAVTCLESVAIDVRRHSQLPKAVCSGAVEVVLKGICDRCACSGPSRDAERQHV
jgi:Fur family ferric uptake transcriptional regulator